MKTRTHTRSSGTPQSASVDSLADLIGELKSSVSQRLTREFRQCVPVVVIRRAVDDAVQVARSTDFPHLFFPALAEEKVRLVSAALCDEVVGAPTKKNSVGKLEALVESPAAA